MTTRTMKVTGSRWTLHREVDFITYETNHPDPDPNWRFTDAAGHQHQHEKTGERYPTLRYVIDGQHWCDGISEGSDIHDPHMQVDVSHYECAQCHEHIRPGMRPPGPRSMPGHQRLWLSTTRIDGPIRNEIEVHPANGDDCEELVRRWRMTNDGPIRDRIADQYAEQHPDDVHIVRQSSPGW